MVTGIGREQYPDDLAPTGETWRGGPSTGSQEAIYDTGSVQLDTGSMQVVEEYPPWEDQGVGYAGYAAEEDPAPHVPDAHAAFVSSRREIRAARTRTKRKRRGRMSLFVSLVVVGVAVAAAYFGLRPIVAAFNAPDDYPGPGTGEVRVVVAPGDSGGTIGRTLAQNGVILSAKRFIEEAAVDARVQTIQPGTYALKKEMSVTGAIDVLAQPANRIITKVTIPEGRRAGQVVEVLAEKGGFDAKALTDALAAPESIGLPAAANGVVEGWLFPATYEFEPGTTPTTALAAMVTRTKDELADLAVAEADWVTVLTKASIVQVEAGKLEDFPKVARVIENRLAIDMPLQMDSTVSYATKTFNEDTTAAQRASDSPYNTYKFNGLPPGAISNPGRAAVEAVLAPVEGDWLFFVTVNLDTAETKFAVTGAEHARNVEEYRAWARANR